jgi:hypothetical protein
MQHLSTAPKCNGSVWPTALKPEERNAFSGGAWTKFAFSAGGWGVAVPAAVGVEPFTNSHVRAASIAVIVGHIAHLRTERKVKWAMEA